MRLTLPHAGNLSIIVKGIAQKTGVDLVVPPPTSQHTLSLGVKYAPETVCLPFKLTLGNMIEALELGADTILTIGQYGPCRFGYYHRLQEVILRELGYHFEMVRQSLGIRGIIKRVGNGASMLDVVNGFRLGIARLKALEEVEESVHRIRAIERDKGSATRIFREAAKAMDEAGDYREIRQAKRGHLSRLLSLPTLPAEPLKIGVIGEFFVVVDAFANMDIEIELGKLGVEVVRPQSVLEWLDFNPIAIALGRQEKQRSRRAAMPYLSRHVGGDGWQSVGEKVLHAKDWDGMVHIEPFGCLPEITARNIMPSVKEELPVLNIIFDEHTSRVGVVNRLEAFVDMLYRKKRKGLKA